MARGRAAGATPASPTHRHRPAPAAGAPNRVWAVDIQFDATTDGRPVKIVSINDEHTRECLGGLVTRSVTADVLIDELDRLALRRGYPAVPRCDNGPELACPAMADWASDRVGLAFIPTRRALAQRLRRIVQLPRPRRMPEHQQHLVLGPSASSSATGRTTTTTAGGTARLATRPQRFALPPAPTMNDSHAEWINSWGLAKGHLPLARRGMPHTGAACRLRYAGPTSNQLKNLFNWKYEPVYTNGVFVVMGCAVSNAPSGLRSRPAAQTLATTINSQKCATHS